MLFRDHAASEPTSFVKLLAAIIIFGVNVVEGQVKETESAIDVYSQSRGHNSGLYNGREYIAYRPVKDEHPYLTLDWEEGDVLYDGRLYQGIGLLYDVSVDQLITKYYNDDDIQLIREKISYFTLGKRKFVSLYEGVPTVGFYEILRDGPIKVFSRFEKKFLETVSGREVHREFEEKTRWYIAFGGKYFAVRNKRSLRDIFPDHQAELKKYIREGKLSFKTSTMPKDLVTIAELCEKFL